MDAAVDHVHHRHRQHARLLAAEVAEERDAGLRRRAFAAASETPRIAFAPSRPLFGVPSSSTSSRSSPAWSAASRPRDRRGDLALDVRDRRRHALAAVRLAAVAELDRLVDAGRGARRHGGPAERAGLEPDVDLDGRVPARVEDLAGVDVGDRGHCSVSLARSK